MTGLEKSLLVRTTAVRRPAPKTGSAKGGLKKVTNEVLSLRLQGAPERIFGSNHNSGSLHKDANANDESIFPSHDLHSKASTIPWAFVTGHAGLLRTHPLLSNRSPFFSTFRLRRHELERQRVADLLYAKHPATTKTPAQHAHLSLEMLCGLTWLLVSEGVSKLLLELPSAVVLMPTASSQYQAFSHALILPKVFQMCLPRMLSFAVSIWNIFGRRAHFNLPLPATVP
jgi:hypothetical protein